MNDKRPSPISYRDAGVDIDAGDRLVENIKPLASRTLGQGVLAGIGGFGALFEVPKRYKEPVLVSGTDGVGTKLKLAIELDRHDTIGIDLVAMSINDIIVQGAEPLFFLDYFACGSLNVDTATAVVAGIAKGCELAGCALIGGETAEMPGMYPDGEYDLAGFAVGVVEKSAIIDGRAISPGDVVLGLASNGVHSNGYSLVRRIIDRAGIGLSSEFDGKTLGDVLLEPTRIYARSIRSAMHQTRFKGLAHITGGGLVENVPRVLPEGVLADLHRDRWQRPHVFDWLQKSGNVEDAEMLRVFNCGIGMVAIVSPADAGTATQALERSGERVWVIGEIRTRRAAEPQTIVR